MESNTHILTQAYNEYSDAIFRYCFFKLSDREKALDLVQETYTRVWQYIESGKTVVNMKTFLYTIARNLIVDEYRKKKTSSLDDLVDTGHEPILEIEESLYDSLDIERVKALIDELPEKYSSILVLRYVNDLSVKEIAEIVGESENVISVRIHRGLAKLKNLITP